MAAAALATSFTVNASDFIRTYLEPTEGAPLPLPEIHRDLALHMQRSWADNEVRVARLFGAFQNRIGAARQQDRGMAFGACGPGVDLGAR